MLLNRQEPHVTSPHFTGVQGDARDLSRFRDREFDVVFSNSVIEHVGDYADQRRMADEIRRIGKRYFLQTPNRHFPIEPHFLFPFFQFLPLCTQVWLVSHLSLGWHRKVIDRQEAVQMVASIRLLTRREMQELFPEATLVEEKFGGLTKSFIVHAGWDCSTSERH